MTAGQHVALDSGSWNASALVLVLIQEARRRTEVVLAESDTVDLAECEPPVASAAVVLQRDPVATPCAAAVVVQRGVVPLSCVHFGRRRHLPYYSTS